MEALAAPVDYDLVSVRRALAEAGRRVIELVRTIRNPSVPVPGSDWTVGDVAAHLAAMVDANAGYVTGAHTAMVDLGNLPASNREVVAGIDERSPSALADRLADGLSTYLSSLDCHDALDAQFWHGVTIPYGAAAGIILGELLLHGEDIARALDRPWSISRRQALLVLDGVITVAPLFVDRDAARGVNRTYEIRLRGGHRTVWRFTGGELTVRPSDGEPVDCRIVADPVAFLQVTYKRRSQWAEIGRGHLVAWGHKPWLAFRLLPLIADA